MRGDTKRNRKESSLKMLISAIQFAESQLVSQPGVFVWTSNLK